MFSHEFIRELRARELETILTRLRPGSRLLEIGGGNGVQAKALADRGYSVVSIDIPSSRYRAQRVFPVIEYDGATLPFADASFDVVFTSNVLEHVPHLARMHREIARVLRPEGYAVHVMPTAAWRFWTLLTWYPGGVQAVADGLKRAVPRGFGAELRRIAHLRHVANLVLTYAFPRRHGETGTAVSELWTFSRRAWRRNFRRNGYAVEEATPMGLFYTGSCVLGLRWSFESRAKAAKRLGSACVLYRVRPLREGPAHPSTPPRGL